ncbi:hypothetical protein HDU76_003759, partial [Blyttiomyces sp. JEL0837]
YSCTFVFNTEVKYEPIWWTLQLVIFGTAQMIGTKALFNMATILTIYCTLVMIALTFPLLPHVNFQYWALDNYFTAGNDTLANDTDVIPSDLTTQMFPHGIHGIFNCLPYALWMYLGMECLPLLTEEAKDMIKDGPKSMFLSMFSSTTIYWAILLFTSSTALGVSSLSGSLFVQIDPIAHIYGLDPTGTNYKLLVMFCFIPLIYISTLTPMYAFSRQAFALARNGYLPTIMALTEFPGKKEPTPWISTAFSILITLALALVTRYQGTANLAVVLQNSSVLYAGLAYIATACSYIYFKLRHPEIKRHFSVPSYVGITCAIFVNIWSIATISSILQFPENHLSAYIFLWKMLTAMVEFFIIHRKHLVLSPEEIFIQTHMGQGVQGIEKSTISLDAVEHMSMTHLPIGISEPRLTGDLEAVLEEDEEENGEENEEED